MALTKLPRLFWRIDADRHHLRLACHKLRQLLLKAPQLGVDQRSPVATGEKRNEAECSEQRDSEADPYKPIPASSHKRSRYVIVAPLDGFLKRTVSETVDAAIVHCPGSVDPEPEGISRQFAKRRGPHGV